MSFIDVIIHFLLTLDIISKYKLIVYYSGTKKSRIVFCFLITYLL